jgi:hypothetical protein
MALLFAAACSVDLPAEQILCGPPPDRCPDGWYCHETDGHCRRTPESDACEPPARGSRLDWSLVFAPQEQQATISAIEIDSFDNVYISGSAFGPLDLGCGEVSPPNVSADRDGFVARLSPEGRLDWLRMFGANGVDDIIDLALGASALMVTGRFSGQPAIEMADGTVRDLASNAGSDDIVVAALDPMTGTAIWVETFGGPREDTASAITTRGRRVCLTGRFREQIFFEGEPHVADDESSNAFVACLD